MSRHGRRGPARRDGAGRWMDLARRGRWMCGRWMWMTGGGAAMLTLLGCAHKPPPAGPKPAAAKTGDALCSLPIAAGPADKVPPRDRTFAAEDWFALLLQGYRPAGALARPARDCTGQPVKLEVDGCVDDPVPISVDPPPLTARDLIVSSLGDARRLVWAITDRLPSGQAEGPVALVEIEAHRTAVRAIGVLRAFPENVTLRLEKLGGAPVLVAEGERCVKPQVPELCQRGIRVVPLIGNRFAPKPLVDDKGACLGNAFLVTRSGGAAGGRHSAKYQLEGAVTFSPDAIAVREQLAISLPQAASDPNMESFVTRVQAERQITLQGGNLVATGPSVLARWLAQQHGATNTSSN